MTCGVDQVDCTEVREGLIVPTVLMDSPNLDKFIEVAGAILDTLPPEAKLVPWVIGSTDRDLAGTERQSKSHQEGEAFDMSPCYSDTILVPEDRRIMGMAWNIVSLIVVAPACEVACVCVEGDHLHVMVDRDPLNKVFCVPTVAAWYPIAETVELTPAQMIFNKLFVFDAYTWRPASRDEADEFVAAFSSEGE